MRRLGFIGHFAHGRFGDVLGEDDDAQRRQGHRQRVVEVAVERCGRGFHASHIAVAGTAVFGRVAVENLLPVAAGFDAHVVIQTRDRREVADYRQEPPAGGVFAQEADDAVVGVVKIDPGKTVLVEIRLRQGRFIAVQVVQIAHPLAQTIVVWIFEQMPVETVLEVPFAMLAELTAHEQEFLARVGEHVAEEQSQVGDALPRIARHAAVERAFAMDDLVVRERQDEVLGEGVPDRERQFVLMILAVDAVMAHVLERVVLLSMPGTSYIIKFDAFCNISLGIDCCLHSC